MNFSKVLHFINIAYWIYQKVQILTREIDHNLKILKFYLSYNIRRVLQQNPRKLEKYLLNTQLCFNLCAI